MKRLVLGIVAALLVPCSAMVQAQVLGTVDRIVGSASILAIDGASLAITAGQSVHVGNTIHTGPASEVHILTQDGGYLALRPSTHVVLQRYHAQTESTAGMELKLLQGALRSITGWVGKLYPSGYKVITPTATVGIRGTDHEVSVLDQTDGDDLPGTYNSVLEGATWLRNREGVILELEAGHNGFVALQEGAAPRLLARRPAFLLRRLLQLEDRIEERREAMRERIEEFAREHPERVQMLRERWEKLSPQQKDKARDALRTKVQRRRQAQ